MRAFFLIVVGLALVLGAVGCGGSGLTEVRCVESPKRESLPFLRADLVDVAAYVGRRVGRGFVLSSPELGSRALTLYHPEELEGEALVEIFELALSESDLVVEERSGVWLIREASEAAIRKEGGGWVVDVRSMPLSEVLGYVSQVSGRRFVLSEAVRELRLSVQSRQPLQVEALVDLIVLALEVEGVSVQERGGVLVIDVARADEG